MHENKLKILNNYKFVLYDHSAKRSTLIQNEQELQRMLASGEIGDGDIVVELTAENTRVAARRNYLELI